MESRDTVDSVQTRAGHWASAIKRGAPARKLPPPFSGATVSKALRILRREAPKWNAPVMTLVAAQTRDPFMTLVGCILSLRTRDQVTAIAARQLFARANTPSAILAMPPHELEKSIYPVGFYRTKARVIRDLSRDLIDKFEGHVPDEIDVLMTLKGVGRKTANLVVTEAFRKPGICVDTHVHRISNRWGLVRTATPEKTEQALREVLPRRYWLEYNGLLVAFGQTICQPRFPRCPRCPLEKICPKIGVAGAR